MARHHGRRPSGRRDQGNPRNRSRRKIACCRECCGQRCVEAAGHQAGPAADPHPARGRHSRAGRKNAGRSGQGRRKYLLRRSGKARQAGIVQCHRIPGKLCGGDHWQRGYASAAQELTVRLIFITLLALIVATVVGVGATGMTATRGTDLGTRRIGAWTARPKTGTAEVDPFSGPSIAPGGGLPVGTGDGVAFSATTDDRKRPLDGRCDVVVSGVTPAARFWTLTLYDQKGRLVANSLQRYGFTSQEIIRGSGGAFEVRVASRSRAGNWLPTGGIERYALMLRLYDTPVGVATRTQRDAPMPSIATVGCP